MRFTFGSKELVRCLTNLHFTAKKQLATSHQKFFPPAQKAVHTAGQRSFIMVQMRQKEYDPHARTRYLRQIMNFGYSEDDILTAFK
jgi:hypothetical protein